MSGAQQHPYHLVEPSPWPAVGSAAAFIAAIGAVMFMHDRAYGGYVLMTGMGLVILTMFMWWRDVIREAEYQGHHTPIVQIVDYINQRSFAQNLSRKTIMRFRCLHSGLTLLSS